MRPLGVTLVGFYQILRGVLALLFGLSVLLFTGLAAKLASLAAEGNAVERLLRDFGHVAGLGIIVFARRPHACRLRRPADAELGTSPHAPVFRRLDSCWFSPASCTDNVLRCSSERLTRPVSSISAMPPIKRAFHAEGNPMRMAA